MFRPSKLVLTSLTIFMIAVLSACNLVGQPAQSTATPTMDLTAIGTVIAETMNALTVNAPTTAPTLTIAPSDTPAGVEATNTQGIIPVEETLEVSATSTPIVVDGETPFPSSTPFGDITAIPSFTPVLVAATSVGPYCKNSALDSDVTIPDGTVMKPGENFEKIWAITNTGTCRWDDGFFFAPWEGPASMASGQAWQGRNKFSQTDRFVEPGETILISIDMYAPEVPNEYVAHWSVYDDNGQAFGQDFTVVIKVVK